MKLSCCHFKLLLLAYSFRHICGTPAVCSILLGVEDLVVCSTGPCSPALVSSGRYVSSWNSNSRTGSMAQVVERYPSKCEALSWIPITTKLTNKQQFQCNVVHAVQGRLCRRASSWALRTSGKDFLEEKKWHLSGNLGDSGHQLKKKILGSGKYGRAQEEKCVEHISSSGQDRGTRSGSIFLLKKQLKNWM
jgi:hypothetical protein